MTEKHARQSEQARDDRTQAALERKNRNVLLAGVGGAVLMVGVSFAAVPLYDLFCRVTGFGGTTGKISSVEAAETVPLGTTDEFDQLPTYTIRFDANIDPSLQWRFRPAQGRIELKPGRVQTAYYLADSRGSGPSVGSATYNVSPAKAGQYLDKVDCFCFTEQLLGAGKTAKLPVTFRVDPAILDDPDIAEVRTITLSYTFYRKGDVEAISRLHLDQDELERAENDHGDDGHDHSTHDHGDLDDAT